MPGLNQEAFSIVTQILEYWQYNYFTEGIEGVKGNDGVKQKQSDLKDERQEGSDEMAKPQSSLLKDSAETAEAFSAPAAPDTVATVTSDVAPEVAPSQSEAAPSDNSNKDLPSDTVTVSETASVDTSSDTTAPSAADQLPVAPAQTNESTPPSQPQIESLPEPQPTVTDESISQADAPPSEPVPVVEAQPAAPSKTKETTTKAKLVFGNTVSPIHKSDGAWNFHTVLRFIRSDVFTFETIFSRPTKKQPVPKATGSVWFQLEKKDSMWHTKYRFESNHQDHHFKFDDQVVRTGFTDVDKAELARQSSLLASPLRRMIDVIASKELCSAEMEHIDLFQAESLAAQSKFLPSPMSV